MKNLVRYKNRIVHRYCSSFCNYTVCVYYAIKSVALFEGHVNSC